MTAQAYRDNETASIYSDGWTLRQSRSRSVHTWRASTRLAWLTFGVRPFLFAGDCAAFVLAVVLTATLSTQATAAFYALFLTIVVAWYQRRGLYRSRLTLRLLDDLPTLVAGVLLASVACSLAVAVGPGATAPELLAQVLFVAGAFGGFVVLSRWLLYALVYRARKRGWIRHPTLVLGAGPTGSSLSRTLSDHPEYGLSPVGFLHGSTDPSRQPLELPVLGAEADLAAAIVEHDVHAVVVGHPSLPEAVLVDLVLTCDRLDCEIFIVPRLFELHRADVYTDQAWGIPLDRLRRPFYRSAQWRLKRAMDIVCSALALLLAAPLMAVIALSLRMEAGPDVVFRQQRVGQHGRTFTLMKFRSLAPASEAESASQWSISNDDRLRPVGRFVRRSSLDELPQLWNVLRGDMSLVGPRPERPYFVDDFSRRHAHYHARHRVPAGMTGWAQVHGLRGDTSIEERVQFDNYYITNWSLWLDIRIMLRTVYAVLRQGGS